MKSLRAPLLAAGLALGLSFTLAAPAAACPTHSVPLPAAGTKGPPLEVRVLLDTPFTKLVSITLRDGTKLPEHTAPHAVTIQALRGRGVVVSGATRDPLGPDAMVLLGPGTAHEVTPAGKDELVLLVTHLLTPGEAAKVKPHH